MRLITNGKYQLGGEREETIGLPVFPQNLPTSIEVEGYTLLRRTDFHVSLVAIGKIIKKHGITDPEFLQNVIADFLEFIKDNEIALLRYRNEFKFVAENERRSVVVMCDVSNLDRFFTRMNEKYHVNAEYPPTHVTLFTLQPNSGIYLVDARGIASLTKPIEISELNASVFAG